MHSQTKVLLFHLVAYKGDLKFLQQSLNFTRHAGREQAGYKTK